MYKMTILYGTPQDPAAFRRYYEETHVPIARRMPGLTGWTLTWLDTDPAQPGPWFLVAALYAESRQAMDDLLASPAGAAARADLANFVTGTVEFLPGLEVQVALA